MLVICMLHVLISHCWCDFSSYPPTLAVPGAACPGGDSCHFAHGEEELRKPGEAVELSVNSPLFQNRFGSMVWWWGSISHRIHVWYIYANIWGILIVNVSIYTIHGFYGYWYMIVQWLYKLAVMSMFLLICLFIIHIYIYIYICLYLLIQSIHD